MFLTHITIQWDLGCSPPFWHSALRTPVFYIAMEGKKKKKLEGQVFKVVPWVVFITSRHTALPKIESYGLRPMWVEFGRCLPAFPRRKYTAGNTQYLFFPCSPVMHASPKLFSNLLLQCPEPLVFLQMRLEYHTFLICLETIKQHHSLPGYYYTTVPDYIVLCHQGNRKRKVFDSKGLIQLAGAHLQDTKLP